jgi:hypothetical protein
MKKLISINQLLNFYVNLITRNQNWHWHIFIVSVAATLHEKVDLDKPTIEFLREQFYKDPTLELAYFYCCSTDPHVAIFNNELQPDVDGSVIWNHISNLIGSPIG